MWDVKKIADKPWISVLHRFTLTMWDVKETMKELETQIAQMFYLNYVGCKV